MSSYLSFGHQQMLCRAWTTVWDFQKITSVFVILPQSIVNTVNTEVNIYLSEENVTSFKGNHLTLTPDV